MEEDAETSFPTSAVLTGRVSRARKSKTMSRSGGIESLTICSTPFSASAVVQPIRCIASQI